MKILLIALSFLVVLASGAQANIVARVTDADGVPLSSADGDTRLYVELALLSGAYREYVAGCYGAPTDEGCADMNGMIYIDSMLVGGPDGYVEVPLIPGQYELTLWANGKMLKRTPIRYNGVHTDLGVIVMHVSPIRVELVSGMFKYIPSRGGTFRPAVQVYHNANVPTRFTVRMHTVVTGMAINDFGTMYGAGSQDLTVRPDVPTRRSTETIRISRKVPAASWTCANIQFSDPKDPHTVYGRITACAVKQAPLGTPTPPPTPVPTPRPLTN